MTPQHESFLGLTESDVVLSRMENGTNSLEHQNKNNLIASLIDMIKEPMFLLLDRKSVV